MCLVSLCVSFILTKKKRIVLLKYFILIVNIHVYEYHIHLVSMLHYTFVGIENILSFASLLTSVNPMF